MVERVIVNMPPRTGMSEIGFIIDDPLWKDRKYIEPTTQDLEKLAALYNEAFRKRFSDDR